jgi:hypothetical protein
VDAAQEDRRRAHAGPQRVVYDSREHGAGRPCSPGRTTIQAGTPPAVPGFVALDWKDGQLVGIEILDASVRLHRDLLDQAEING